MHLNSVVNIILIGCCLLSSSTLPLQALRTSPIKAINQRRIASSSNFQLGLNKLDIDSLPRTPRQIKMILAGATEVFKVPIDQCQYANLLILSFVKVKDFYLISPRGERFNEEQLTSPRAEISKTSHFGEEWVRITIPQILPGRWSLYVTTYETGIIEVSAAIANERRVELNLDKNVYKTGEKIFFKSIFRDGMKAIKGAHLTVEIISSNSKPFTLLLFDDGQHRDGIAGDGIYANDAIVELPSGDAIIYIRAKKGIIEREAKSNIQIFSGEHSLRLLAISDTIARCAKGDLCLEYQVFLQVRFATKAHYQISGYLQSLSEKFVANAFYSTIKAGEPMLGKHDVMLRFSGQQIFKSGIDGPYQLLIVVESLDAEFNIVNKEFFPKIYVSKPYLHSDFK